MLESITTSYTAMKGGGGREKEREDKEGGGMGREKEREDKEGEGWGG